MPSFASQTKKELTQIQADSCCERSELSAIVRINGTLRIRERRLMLEVATENAAIARRIYTLYKQLYGVGPELFVRRKMRLKKNNVYFVRITGRGRGILKDLKIMDEDGSYTHGIDAALIRSLCCARAYLRGAFLAGGSVNNPGSASYHLELASHYQEHSEAICDLCNRFGLNAKWIERKKGYIVYIKEGEKITEFLNLIGAHRALLQFEDVRIVKDMRNSVNRIVNCETANLNKTISAAMRQVDNIRLIERELGFDQLAPGLRQVAELRLKHPDMSLRELSERLSHGKVSKSGINHRLRKLNQIADKLRRASSKR